MAIAEPSGLRLSEADGRPQDGPAAELLAADGPRALVSRRGGAWVFERDLPGFLASVLNEKDCPQTGPMWGSLPVEYRAVPVPLRMAVLKVLMRLKGGAQDGREYGTFLRFLRLLREAGYGPAAQGPRLFFPKEPTLLLSHDIETEEGFGPALAMAGIEESFGFRSVWHIVTGEYPISHGALRELRERGHGIGWHELLHDNRFAFLDPDGMEERIRRSADFLREYGVAGFRSPSYLATPRMFSVLRGHFRYDSSRLDHDTLTGWAPRGCKCPYPFYLECGLLEIPVTVPFESPYLAGADGPDCWEPKLAVLIESRALIHINTHPDAHFCGSARMLKRYRDLLARLKGAGVAHRRVDEFAEHIHGERKEEARPAA